ncbi:MAG: hypothetical protein II388_04755 [Clostridia bacterium]|nr:hypothetical protein [Clostridia bacterium]
MNETGNILPLLDILNYIKELVVIFNGMHYYNIELTTESEMMAFVKIVADEPGVVRLADGNGCCVNGKSLLGALATIEWATLYCVSEDDIYFKIKKFCIGEMEQPQDSFSIEQIPERS